MSETISCPACGSSNEADRKFCGECGTALAQTCPSCGTPNAPSVKFCGECGTALGATTAPAAVAPVTSAPAAERRLVSVLFADLVGFTTLSESRDAEEVRELLSRYFDTCRTLIELYGGTVEKFIGDAVMAVWGTPIATEDDAERAVRAALDLVAAVSALGDEVGAPELARARRRADRRGRRDDRRRGPGHGRRRPRQHGVADPVGCASPARCSSARRHGARRERSDRLRGRRHARAEGQGRAAQLWRALRVVSGRRGALKSTGLEAPFVGRDRELRLVKELFHASAEERTRASRLGDRASPGSASRGSRWEFYKYFDGLVDNVYWHRGRCLAYGEGVTYWALADMVRMRARIAEDEDDAHRRARSCDATLEEHVLDADERAFVEPRLAHLLGLAEEQARASEQDLFAAWRLFFERLANTYPTVLVFEDMQWADASLLDFVEYLLEWSRSRARSSCSRSRGPSSLERRPSWGAGHAQLHVALPRAALASGDGGAARRVRARAASASCATQILGRAEGVPLYAVETVRMLLDRGLLVQEGAVYRPTGEIAALEVPETLHALIAARLDGLPAGGAPPAPGRRRARQDVHARRALAGGRRTDRGGARAAARVARRARRSSASRPIPRSPEHGQYGFLQDLVRHVAYETLSKQERRARHLAAAAYLEGVVRRTRTRSSRSSPRTTSTPTTALPTRTTRREVKAKAREALVRAGDRAESLGAAGEAQRYFEQAAELADDHRERADLLDRAGWLGRETPSDVDCRRDCSARSIALLRGRGRSRMRPRACRAGSRRSSAAEGASTTALARAERAFANRSQEDEPTQDLAVARRPCSRRAYVFIGEPTSARPNGSSCAIELAESLGSPEATRAGLHRQGARRGCRTRGRPRRRPHSSSTVSRSRSSTIS